MNCNKDCLKEISQNSQRRYYDLKTRLEDAFAGKEEYSNICIYACGSMGRFDMSTNSDLDLFFVVCDDSGRGITSEDEDAFFDKIKKINTEMGFKPFSRDGEFLKFTSQKDLLDIGSQKEDYNNSFTARLLLLLESKPLFNEQLYEQLIEDAVDKYLCDYKDHKENFSPLFIMNDILRYWYTLTLNYEFRRDPSDSVHKKNWRRLKLKFARLITCFSLYMCLFENNINHNYVIKCVKRTPIERLEMLQTKLPEAKEIIEEIKNEYHWYLELRKENEGWWTEENKANAIKHADKFHDLVTHKLMKIVVSFNPTLKEKTELNL